MLLQQQPSHKMNEEMTHTKEANNARKEKKEVISPLSLTKLGNDIVVQCLFWEVPKMSSKLTSCSWDDWYDNGKLLFQISLYNRLLESLALLVPNNTVCHAATATNHWMDKTVVVVVTLTMLLTRTCNFSGNVSVFCLQHLWLLSLCLLSFHVEPHSVALFRCLQNLCKTKIWNRTCAYVCTVFDGKKPESYWSLAKMRTIWLYSHMIFWWATFCVLKDVFPSNIRSNVNEGLSHAIFLSNRAFSLQG